jgi:hypothetical protein
MELTRVRTESQGLDGAERFGQGEAGGADGGEESCDGSYEDGGGEAARPGAGRTTAVQCLRWA